MDDNYFTPFGARVEAPPVIPTERKTAISYKAMAFICTMSYAAVILSAGHLVYQTYYGLKAYDQQLAWDARR
jgi:hypothetical protein